MGLLIMPERDQSLTGHARRGVAWSALSLAAIAVSQLLYTAFTSRALHPQDFGFYACAQALASLCGYLSLTTLGSAVMRQPEGRARHLVRNSLGLAIAFGMAAAIISLGLTSLWTRMWHLPAATTTVQLAAILVLLSPVTAVSFALVRRQLRYRAAALVELASTLVGFGVGALLVAATRAPTGLMLGQAAASAMAIILCLPHIRSDDSGSAVEAKPRDLLPFASKVSIQNAVYFAIYNLPALATSRALGSLALGLYSRANILVTLPLTQATQVLFRVLYPLWGRIKEPDRLRTVVTDTLAATSFIGCLAFGCLLGMAQPIVEVLLGSGFRDAVPLVQVLCIFGMLNMCVTITGSLQESSNWMSNVWRVQLVTGVGLASLAALLVWPSVLISAAALTFSQVLGHALQVHQLNRRGVVSLPVLMRAYVQHFAIGCLVGAALFGVSLLFSRVTIILMVDALLLAVVGSALVRYGDSIPGLRVLTSRGLFKSVVTQPGAAASIRVLRSGRASS